MESGLRSIGELARASGLTVSALRFYDRTGVLVPALVDPVTGYRWYTDDQVLPARLVAGLRRVGMPLAEITAAVRHRRDPAAVARLLDGHLRRLTDGLADARRELSRVRTLIDPEEPMTTRLTLSPAAFAAAVDAVRFAVGDDPDLPVLAGVLCDLTEDGLRLVATDRHRLAVARVAGTPAGPPVRALVPVALVDEVRALLATTGPQARLTVSGQPVAVSGQPVAESGQPVAVSGQTVAVSVGDREVSAACLPYDFPDYRRLLRDPASGAPTRRVRVDVAALRESLTAGRPAVREHDGVRHEVTALGLDGRDGLRVLAADDLAADDPGTLRVGVNREYLLEALAAGGRGQLVLELDGPITPLAVRREDDADAFSILMPIRL